MQLTEKEAKLLDAIVNNDYSAGDPTAPTWTWAAIDAAGMNEQVGGGVLTSLQNKGLVTVDFYERDDRGEDLYQVGLTDAGRKAWKGE